MSLQAAHQAAREQQHQAEAPPAADRRQPQRCRKCGRSIQGIGPQAGGSWVLALRASNWMDNCIAGGTAGARRAAARPRRRHRPVGSSSLCGGRDRGAIQRARPQRGGAHARGRHGLASPQRWRAAGLPGSIVKMERRAQKQADGPGEGSMSGGAGAAAATHACICQLHAPGPGTAAHEGMPEGKNGLPGWWQQPGPTAPRRPPDTALLPPVLPTLWQTRQKSIP